MSNFDIMSNFEIKCVDASKMSETFEAGNKKEAFEWIGDSAIRFFYISRYMSTQERRRFIDSYMNYLGSKNV